MNLDHNIVQVSHLSEHQKKVFTKNGVLFSPNSGEDQEKKVFTKNRTLFFPEFKWTPTLRCTPEPNYWGDANVDHTQTIGGDTVKLLEGGYIFPSPPGFGTPVYYSLERSMRRPMIEKLQAAAGSLILCHMVNPAIADVIGFMWMLYSYVMLQINK